ncbi:hypothetical protein [Klebsiella pneumoniae]|uniref:Uncharacterized protein n=1 Tax=Pseudomonas phage Epa1 TaxID=2719568 RepID=A0A6G9LHE8_9CAUD|nr:hypothetical protein [Klebsiella pneumoniae]QIQ64431.1 hypothetical protein Epa1_p36 [Pseudomonas phage Epa1]WOR80476.1 hypothetical protein PSP30_gp40 [Pseudomonas phage PSP30]
MDNKYKPTPQDEARKEAALEAAFSGGWGGPEIDADDFELGNACGLDPEVCESCQ